MKNWFMVINKLIYNRVFMEGKTLRITLKRSQSSHANSWKVIAIRDLRWLNSRPVTVKNATIYFHLLYWDFCLVFHENFCFYYFHFFSWWSIKFPQQNINHSKTRIWELTEVCGNYTWILKWVDLHLNWISLMSQFSQTMSSRLEMHIQNPVKYLRWSVWQKS